MRFIFQKPDMDTVLTAFLLGYGMPDQVEHTPDKAPQQALDDPSVFCIECGGSGQVWLGNYDHHDTNLPLPPACVQACKRRRVVDSALLALVRYVEEVDTAAGFRPGRNDGPSLSSIFSGMLLVNCDPLVQFRTGIEIFQAVLTHGIDPWTPAPTLAEWHRYAEAKRKQKQTLSSYQERAEFFVTRSGLKGGYLEAPCPGVHGLLRGMGCEISIARGLSGIGSSSHCTIAGKNSSMLPVLSVIREFERGWGGPANGRIIASPSTGTRLKKKELIDIVSEGI